MMTSALKAVTFFAVLTTASSVFAPAAMAYDACAPESLSIAKPDSQTWSRLGSV